MHSTVSIFDALEMLLSSMLLTQSVHSAGWLVAGAAELPPSVKSAFELGRTITKDGMEVRVQSHGTCTVYEMEGERHRGSKMRVR